MTETNSLRVFSTFDCVSTRTERGERENTWHEVLDLHENSREVGIQGPELHAANLFRFYSINWARDAIFRLALHNVM